MAIVAEGEHARVYLPPTPEIEDIAGTALPTWTPEGTLVQDPRAFTPILYGLSNWRDLYTSRQLQALTCLSELVQETRDAVMLDALASGFDDGPGIASGGIGATAYGDALAVFMALCLDKAADYNNALCTWNPTNQNVGHLFTKQAIPMGWDFVEASPLHGGLSFDVVARGVSSSIEMLPAATAGIAFQADAAAPIEIERRFLISTDPPYYDNVPYADLSDFFYGWLRHSLSAYL